MNSPVFSILQLQVFWTQWNKTTDNWSFRWISGAWSRMKRIRRNNYFQVVKWFIISGKTGVVTFSNIQNGWILLLVYCLYSDLFHSYKSCFGTNSYLKRKHTYRVKCLIGGIVKLIKMRLHHLLPNTIKNIFILFSIHNNVTWPRITLQKKTLIFVTIMSRHNALCI